MEAGRRARPPASLQRRRLDLTTDPLLAALAADTDAGLRLAARSLEGLTDEEFWWEPAPNCWTVRRAAGAVPGALPPIGDWAIDGLFTNPDPAPLTTIAWRLNHMTIAMVGYLDLLVRDPEFVGVEASADLAVAAWRRTADAFAAAVRGLDSESAIELVHVDHWGRDVPRWSIVGHILREQIHHAAEIGCLRDLKRFF